MKTIAIAVHGGASESSTFLKKHQRETEEGLAQAVQSGYNVLKKGGSALDAVVEAVKLLEDNPLFNAGRGSALNCQGEIEIDAAIMNGKNLKAGAVSMVRSVKNPIILARTVMDKTRHVLLSGYGALDIAERYGLQLEPSSYFMTDHQYQSFIKLKERETMRDILKKKMMGTVGAVALDKKGNLAAGTSTGGTSHCLTGRIGDSCVIGAGCYANNQTCAISGTGEGEYLITGVIAHTISSFIEFEQLTLQDACDFVLHTRNRKHKGRIGVIGVNAQGDFGISYNTEIMKRAWISSREQLKVKIFDH